MERNRENRGGLPEIEAQSHYSGHGKVLHIFGVSHLQQEEGDTHTNCFKYFVWIVSSSPQRSRLTPPEILRTSS